MSAMIRCLPAGSTYELTRSRPGRPPDRLVAQYPSATLSTRRNFAAASCCSRKRLIEVAAAYEALSRSVFVCFLQPEFVQARFVAVKQGDNERSLDSSPAFSIQC